MSDFINQFMDRHCKNCSLNEFCTALYEVLCKSTGYKRTAEIVHDLYDTHQICAITVADQAGFRCFEEMLRSDKLKHIVLIECNKQGRDYSVEFIYRAAPPNPAHPMYQTFRKIYKDGIAKKRRNDVYPTDDKVENRKWERDQKALTKVVVKGELISYESNRSVDVNDAGGQGKKTDEGKKKKKKKDDVKDVAFEQADGDVQMFGTEKRQLNHSVEVQKQGDHFFGNQAEQMKAKNGGNGGRNVGKQGSAGF